MATIKFTPLGADGKPIESKKDYKKKSLFTPLRADGKPIDSKEPIKEKPKPKPTLGQKAFNFGKELAKDATKTLLVRPAARATEAITRTLAPESMAAKGYEEMADKKESQKLLGMDIEAQKGFGEGGGKQIVGNALETTGWLYGTGKVANLAMEQAAKQGIKKFGTRLAKEGAISTMLGSSGSQLSESGKIDTKQLVKDVAVGTVLTPIAGIGLSKIFGKKTKLITKESEVKLANDIHNQTTGGKISQESLDYLKNNPIGSDELPINKDGTITLYRKGNIESGKPQSYSLKQGDGQIPVNIPKENILINYNSSKVDDLYNNSFTKEQIDAGYLKQSRLNKLESEIYAISPVENKLTNKIPTIKQTQQALKELPEETYQKYSNNFDEGADYEYVKSTVNNWYAKADEIAKVYTEKDMLDMVTKREILPPEGLPREIVRDYLIKNSKTLTTREKLRLANSSTLSESAANMRAKQAASGDFLGNEYDFVDILNREMKNNLKKQGITSKTINRFLDDIMCK